MQTVDEILSKLRSNASLSNVEGMKRYGINTSNCFGMKVTEIRMIAKDIGKNHELALQLWKTKIHEARHLATMIADPKLVTEEMMENWVIDFDSWDIVDGCCSSLFRKTPFANKKAKEWCDRKEEFVRRAGFSMIAMLAVHDKKEPDKVFEQFFPYIYKYSDDGRNFVIKAVNWALRQIGKRNEILCKKAIRLANKIKSRQDKSSRWVASGVLRELEKYQAEGKIKNVGLRQK